jgi:hypothetical protein
VVSISAQTKKERAHEMTSAAIFVSLMDSLGDHSIGSAFHAGYEVIFKARYAVDGRNTVTRDVVCHSASGRKAYSRRLKRS